MAVRRNVLYGCIAFLAIVVVVGLLPLLFEYLQLKREAAKAEHALAVHSIRGLEISPCMRKFRGLVVVGRIDSLSDGARVEAILKDAEIEANIWIVLYHNGEHIEKSIWRSRVRSKTASDGKRG